MSWPTGAITEELDGFIYEMLISVMIVHLVLSFITEKPYATLQHIVHISTMVIIWDLDWLTILMPIICKYQIWFVEFFVGETKWYINGPKIFINMSLEDKIDIWTVFIASWQFDIHIHSLFPFYHPQQENEHLVFRGILNTFRIKIWHLHLVFIPAISCTPWHLILRYWHPIYWSK